MIEKKIEKSAALLQRAQRVIPGGVNSPVRAFRGVGGQPRFMQRGKGPYIFDVDGNRFVDYVCSWGALILGHAHPTVQKAIAKATANGLSFGAPTTAEVELAELICQLMPSIEMIRMVNSGTEATMTAIRVARGYTNRRKILKFDHCYHGHSDGLLVKAGSGLATLDLADSAGVTPEVAAQTLVAPYNDLAAVRSVFAEHGADIAAIIVEPIAANHNLILPHAEFLPGLRQLCDQHGSVLIFDEVITGFRVSLGGAQALYNVRPDLTCLGKIIGGGLAVGAFGGRRDLMAMLAPLGTVYQAGTLSGNPLAMACGLTTLKELQKPGMYRQINQTTSTVARLFSNYSGVNVTEVCGMFGVKFTDINLFKTFFHCMLDRGVYLAPSAFEVGFVTTAHDSVVLAETNAAIAEAMVEAMAGITDTTTV